ncbi:hypothetical protein FO440_08645 [Mucilaginibacter corticis]|uniref:Uncharacterized protein n=1 Tax=Mucilaginibacter corticis TaxID=2597670 RepID=A0A556MWD6_9SPHI|nr:DUF5677 domain-containing protein [Mucilaginibacter corticis]TSJ44227.1 hypothetical protein FO440_08645 [Mucilaginibacter corticis]
MSNNELLERKECSESAFWSFAQLEPEIYLKEISPIVLAIVLETYENSKFAKALNEEFELTTELEIEFHEAFNLLRVFIDLNRSAGNLILRRFEFEEDSDKKYKVMFAFRFVAMLLKRAESIFSLLKNGFSDDALGRWRTMHELSAVLLTLIKSEIKTVKMYYDYLPIDKCREIKIFQENCPKLNLRPFNENAVKYWENWKNASTSKYGKDFEKPYGWAIKILPEVHKRNLRGLEEIAGISAMRSFYMYAGQSIHAGADSFETYVNHINRKDFFKMSKPTSYGISEPANFCCWTLITVISDLLDLREENEFAVLKQSLIDLYHQTCNEFKKAGNKLDYEKYGQQIV